MAKNSLKFSDDQLELIKSVYIQDSLKKFDQVYEASVAGEESKTDIETREFFIEAVNFRADLLAKQVSRAAMAQDVISNIISEDTKKTVKKTKKK